MTTTLPGPASAPAVAGGPAGPAAEHLDFGPLRIAFDDRLLRPRPWTVAQSTWAAELLADAPPGPVLELCAGAGHIGLLAVLRSTRRLVCVDVSPVACAYTLENAAAAGLADRVEAREGRMDEVVDAEERFALVIADPPWVRCADVDRYPDDPRLAIDGGEDGLDLAWTCVDVAREHLLPGGSLLLQLGTVDQVDALRDRLRQAAEAADAAGAGAGADGADAPGAGAVDLLQLTEVRWCERGVLVRLERP
jgi:release factor glutamine methyltransferase